jgi:hypothetical protein
MLPIIPVGYIVAFLAVAFVATMIWIGIRAVREGRDQQAARNAAHAEIMRRALAKGRSVAQPESGRIATQRVSVPLDDTVWRMQGNAPGQGASAKTGIDWTLTWRIAFRETSSDSVDGPRVWVRDIIQGQLLAWRCASIRTEQPAFTFTHRTNRYDTKPDEINSEKDGPLWRRWRLQAKDDALARRVFNAELLALLEKLPLPRASNTLVDERTVISLGPEGLQMDLGVEELTPELVDLWVGVGEALIGSSQAQ